MRKIRQVQDYLLAASNLLPQMTIPRLLMLHEVAIRGEADQTSLLDYLGLTRSTASKVIASLTDLTPEKAKGPGFVTSTPDPMNLKTKIIRITPKGVATVEGMFRAAWLTD